MHRSSLLLQLAAIIFYHVSDGSLVWTIQLTVRFRIEGEVGIDG